MPRTLLVVTFSAIVMACGGAQSTSTGERDAYVLESGSSYVRLPEELLGARLEMEQAGPDLIRCYETEWAGGEYDLSQVRVDLVISSGRPLVQVAQESDSWISFAGCLETVMMTWDLAPDVVGEGDIVPLEFGPRE